MLSAIQVGQNFELMRKLESAVARNLQDYVATYRQVAPQTDVASIKAMGGVAAFTGIDSPLTTVKGTGAHISTRDLRQVESFFRDHKAPTVTIEMAPWLSEESKQILRERGYIAADHEDVVTTISGTPLARRALRAEPILIHAWPELMRRGSELPDDSATKELVTAAAHLPHAQLYGVRENDRWIACAQSVTYHDVVIMGCDATLPEARGRGAQTTLIGDRLHALPPGKIVMAEVEPNSGSERNYLRCGFQIAYARTHYIRTLQ